MASVNAGHGHIRVTFGSEEQANDPPERRSRPAMSGVSCRARL
jgi:hypothetical protein